MSELDAAVDFRKAEYNALRAEILQTQRHSYQVVAIGALLIPGVNYVVHTKAEVLAAGLPVLVVIVVLMYLSDVYAVTRCGRYIRQHIERPILGEDGGWEQSLQRRDSDSWWIDRTAERYMVASVALLFLSYYCVALWLAIDYLFVFAPILSVIVHGLYIIIGAWLALHMKRSLPISTEVLPSTSVIHRTFVEYDKPIMILIRKRRESQSHGEKRRGENEVRTGPMPPT